MGSVIKTLLALKDESLTWGILLGFFIESAGRKSTNLAQSLGQARLTIT
jgi:hypothetical protein